MTQDEALELLRTGASVFLTGQPGSGKTHTVNRYLRELAEAGIGYAYTASTGIAATHGHGTTIHAWSGIGVRDALTGRDLDGLAANRRLAGRIEKASVLIVDEISMLPAHSLTLVDTVCRHIRASTAPFGGLQVVLVGDFFQLPPVTRRRAEPDMLDFGAATTVSAPRSLMAPPPGAISIPSSAISRSSTGRTTSRFSTCWMPFAPMPARRRTANCSPRA